MDVIQESITTTAVQDIFNAQRAFFQSGSTRSYAFRKKQLQRLRKSLKAHEAAIEEALYNDFRKPAFETFASEVGVLYQEISHTLSNLKEWMRPESVGTDLATFPASGKVHYEPKGVALIIAPWNYPVNLAFAPLIGAIAAGCCAIVKPSEETPHTAAVIEKIVKETFPENYIQVVQGEGALVVPRLMETVRFDHVFFTGSTTVGRIIAKQAAEKLIPTTLELGGKSPAVVMQDADLKATARRICFGKFLNAGQTCVAPDYLLVETAVKEKLIQELQRCITDFYGSNPQDSPDFARIVNDKHFQRLTGYLDQGDIIQGGQIDAHERYIAPTLLDNISMEDAIMQEEIFGPILPILTFEKLDDAIHSIRKNPNPLSLYVFTKSKATRTRLTQQLAFGGGCVNQTIVHLSVPDLPFGGIAQSGLGNYHGRASFMAFSHQKSMLNAKTWLDPKVKYPPYRPFLMKIMKWLWK